MRAPLPTLVLALVLPFAPVALPVARAVQTQQVFATDFESGVPAQMSAPGCVLSGVQGWAGLGTPGNQFGGQFLHYTSVPLFDTKLVLRGLPTHTHVSLGFLLAVIDSWDGTEVFNVSVEGQTLFSNWFQLAQGDASSYVAPPGALLSSGTDLGFTGGGFYFHDRAYDLSLEPAFRDIPHTGDTLAVVWSLGAVSGPAASQWQGGTDESWAIDNVRVTVTLPDVGAPPATGPARLQLAGMRPNPARGGRLLVDFALPSGEPSRLALVDLAGRLVRDREVGELGAGTHRVDLTGGSRLAPGIYLLRLTQGREVRSSRAVVLP